MTPEKSKQKPKSGKRKILKWSGIFIIVMAVLIAGIYLYIGSGHFIRTFVFPRVESRTSRQISAEGISFSPLSSISMKNFTMSDPAKPGDVPLLKVSSFAMNYNGFSFLTGKPTVNSLNVNDPEVNLLVYQDGSTNLEGIGGKQLAAGQPAPQKEGGKQPSRLPDFLLKNLDVTGGNLNITQMNNEGDITSRFSLKNMNASVENLTPGEESRMSFNASLSMEDKQNQTSVENADVQVKNVMTLSKDLSKIVVDAEADVTNFKGQFKGNNVEGYRLTSTLDLNKEDQKVNLSPLSVIFKRGSETAARLHAEGNYNPEQGGGRFNLEVTDIDRTLLNLAGSGAGNVDFRNTTVNYRADMTISEGGVKKEISGILDMNNFSVLAPQISNQPTEEMNLSVAHQTIMDNQTVTIPKLDISAVKQGRKVITGNLQQPLTIDLAAMDKQASEAPPVIYDLKADRLDLVPFLILAPMPEGTSIKNAVLDSDVTINVKGAGQNIGIDGNAKLAGLSGTIQNFDVPPTDLTSSVKMDVSRLSEISIRNLDFGMIRNGEKKNQGSMNGSVNINQGTGKLNITSLNLDMPSLQPFLPADMLTFKSGQISATANIGLNDQFSSLDLKGHADVKNLAALVQQEAGSTMFEFNGKTSLDVSYDQSGKLNVKTAEMAMSERGQPGGKVSLSGNLDMPKGEGMFNLNATDVSEKAFQSIVSSRLEDYELTSLNLSGNQKININNGYKNLTISGSARAVNPGLRNREEKEDYIPPLTIALENDFLYTPEKFLVKKADILANPLEKPESLEKVTITGEVPMGVDLITNKPPFKVRSEQLTLDRYLPSFLFAEEQSGTSGDSSGSAPGAAKQEEELEPLELDYLVFDADVQVDKMNFREIAMSDVKGSVIMGNNELHYPDVTMNIMESPCTMKGSFNFKVPGWKYNFNSHVENLDVAPVVDSLSPTFRGKVTGTANGDIYIEGQGKTDEYLQKHLTGKVEGTLKDGEFTRFPILSALARVTKVTELEQLRFFEGIVNLEIGEGKIDIVDLFFKGKYQKVGFDGWFGLNKTIDLSVQIALAPPLNEKIKKLQYIGELMTDEEGYSELPVPVGMTGTFNNPKPTLKLTEDLKETGKKLLLDYLKKELQDRE